MNTLERGISPAHLRTNNLQFTYYSPLREQIKTVNSLGKYEIREWIRTEGNNYDFSFSPLLGGKSIQEMLDERKAFGKSRIILNLMDYGGALRDLDYTAGLNVALSDPRTDVEKSLDADEHTDLLTGNLIEKKTWKRMEGWLAENFTGTKFDVIMCRPLGGYHYLSQEPGVYLKLLSHAWGLLSRDDGVLLTQMPHVAEKHAYAWAKYFNAHPELGVEAEAKRAGGHEFMKLVKTPHAPQSLLALK